MKKQFFYLSLLAIVLSLGSVLVFAVDDQGNPNNPNVNERANACFEGGTMEGQCVTDLDWVAGWYLIRFEYGLVSRENFPTWLTWVLPVEPEDEAPVNNTPVNTCRGPIYGFVYLDFGGGNFLSNPMGFSDANCTFTYSLLGGGWAYTSAGQAAADAICDANDPGLLATLIANNIYSCVVT